MIPKGMKRNWYVMTKAGEIFFFSMSSFERCILGEGLGMTEPGLLFRS